MASRNTFNNAQDRLDYSSIKNRNLIFSFILFLSYCLSIVTSTNDLQLLIPENGVSLPILGITIPLFTFFLFAPIIVIIFHANVLINLNEHFDKINLWLSSGRKKGETTSLVPFFVDFCAVKTVGQRFFNTHICIYVFVIYLFAPAILASLLFRFGDYQSWIISTLHLIIYIIDIYMLIYFYKGTSGKILLSKFKYISLSFPFKFKFKINLFLIAQGISIIIPVLYTLLIILISISNTSSTLMILGKVEALKILPRISIPSSHMIPLPNITQKSNYHNLLQDGDDSYIPKLDLSDRNLKFIELPYSFLPFVILSKSRLQFAQLGGAFLRRAEISKANLMGAQLWGSDLQEANFIDSDLRGVQLQGANLKNALFVNAYLPEVNLSDANLENADFTQAILTGASLREAKLSRAKFTYAYLYFADLQFAKMMGVEFERADFSGANMWEAELQGANLGFSRMYGTDLRKANLRGANLRLAEFLGTNIEGTDFQGANLYGATLTAVQTDNETKWENAYVSEVNTKQLEPELLDKINEYFDSMFDSSINKTAYGVVHYNNKGVASSDMKKRLLSTIDKVKNSKNIKAPLIFDGSTQTWQQWAEHLKNFADNRFEVARWLIENLPATMTYEHGLINNKDNYADVLAYLINHWKSDKDIIYKSLISKKVLTEFRVNLLLSDGFPEDLASKVLNDIEFQKQSID